MFSVLLYAAIAHVHLPRDYAVDLYRDSSAARLDAENVDVLWFNLLPFMEQMKLLPWTLFARECETDWTWPDPSWRPPCMLVARRYGPHQPAPSYAWVEMTHTKPTVNQNLENLVAWFYISRGSGVWVNTGKTLVYETHAQAVKSVLNKTCYDFGQLLTKTPRPWCIDYFDPLFDALRPMYDSVQFTRHCDMKCGCVAVELVLLRHNVSGASACPRNVELRSGANASAVCSCDERSQYMNCAGQNVGNQCPAIAVVSLVYGFCCTAVLCLMMLYGLKTDPRAPQSADRTPLIVLS